MTPVFRFSHAAGADWQAAANECLPELAGPPPSLGFLYVTDVLASDIGDILEFFRQRTGVAHWVGSVGLGICASGQEYLDRPAMAVMLGEFSPASFKVFSGVRSVDDLTIKRFTCGDRPANFAIVHADPRNNEVPELISGLATRLESGFVVGGLTSSRQQNTQIADKLT